MKQGERALAALGLSTRLGRRARRPSDARPLRHTSQGERRWTQIPPHLSPPRAPLASSSLAWPRKPPPQNPRRWGPGQKARRGTGSRRRRCRGHEKARASLGCRHAKPQQRACTSAGSRHRRHRCERARPRANAGQSGHRERRGERACWPCKRAHCLS
jgi:hypothetical protein